MWRTYRRSHQPGDFFSREMMVSENVVVGDLQLGDKKATLNHLVDVLCWQGGVGDDFFWHLNTSLFHHHYFMAQCASYIWKKLTQKKEQSSVHLEWSIFFVLNKSCPLSEIPRVVFCWGNMNLKINRPGRDAYDWINLTRLHFFGCKKFIETEWNRNLHQNAVERVLKIYILS